jgi:hypothetical protein
VAESGAPHISGKSTFDGPATSRGGSVTPPLEASSRQVNTCGARVNGRVLAALLIVSFTTSGCGNAIYAFQSSSAETKLQQARDLQAEKLAAYEYYMALEYLKQASVEAAEADYGDAIEFAEASEAHSDKAIALSRNAHRGAGR